MTMTTWTPARAWCGTRLAAVAVLAASAAGCQGTGVQYSSAAPPLVVCGKTLSASAAGVLTYDGTAVPRPTVQTLAVGRVLYLRVAKGCRMGAVVEWLPRAAAVLVDEAKAEDGRAVMVVLRPTAAHTSFSVRGTQGGFEVSGATVRLTG